ncbi:MAG: hypothetical protein PHY15_02725 [Eubacteriales bacterium]|nr:hypothetical protein [Eubacteriales bacterium]MDD4474886.1 hypothetical protein [Eubacteriales bacterium]
MKERAQNQVEQTERICYGVEIEPKFVDVAVNRFYQYSSEYRKNSEVYLIRDGEKKTYEEVVGSAETSTVNE